MSPEPMSVTTLNKYIKDKIAQDEFLNNVYVKGEISNFKHHYTGHMYFTLKDGTSLIKCIMFKTANANLNFVPKDGMKVLILGTVAVFERDGVYQIYCKAMKEDGIGSLYQAYEELKRKLEQEGYFDQTHKKKIPFMPQTIGVLTSQTGAVIRDIINVSTRRNPNVHIKLYPVPVQGEGAGEKIAEAIKFMNNRKIADVLILARGGGSLEDLWPFNERVVADAIYNSEIPIISAVGHETDFTISDFVADLRAPTPSAAAELAVADINEIKEKISSYNSRAKLALKKKIEYMKLLLDKTSQSPVFTNPTQKINEYYIMLDNISKNLENLVNIKLRDAKIKGAELIAKLDALSPLKTLTRGYCLTEKDGSLIVSSKQLKKGDNITLRFTDGTNNAQIL
ncbi:MAG: exodeoxyribonuclease VII large subunit [Clostridia bacterium]|nr:exodeoxyribonuclease VII large subunit [Clostridia bacterium]